MDALCYAYAHGMLPVPGCTFTRLSTTIILPERMCASKPKTVPEPCTSNLLPQRADILITDLLDHRFKGLPAPHLSPAKHQLVLNALLPCSCLGNGLLEALSYARKALLDPAAIVVPAAAKVACLL